MTKEIKLAVKALEMMGYEILSVARGTANGPDLHAMREGIVLRIEVKKARPCKRSMAVHPVEEARRHDDLIAVVFPSGYVLIEPMEDYVKNCSATGTRSFFGVY